MCKSTYKTEWNKGLDGRCPNLLVSQEERELEGNGNLTTYEVSVDDRDFDEHYTSLAHMWSSWNAQYVDVDYPRLMIRFEDTCK